MTEATVERANFKRSHAVTATEFSERRTYVPLPIEKPPSILKRAANRFGVALNNNSLWAPGCRPYYAAILDHGLRERTLGLVLHSNEGYFKGTKGFFTNGLREPYGSEGIGAHFEMGGKAGSSIYDDEHPPLQFLPIDRIAYHNAGGNDSTIGIEHAGFGRSTYEWEVLHHNMIGNSGYLGGWLHHRYGLGEPKVSDNINTGTVWPHHAGGAYWGGHVCPADGATGVDHFPYELWEHYAVKSYRTNWMWKK